MGGRTAPRRDKEMMRLLDVTFDKIGRNPTLVARVDVPWRKMAQNTVSYVPGSMAQTRLAALPSAKGKLSDADDEDSAETRSYEEGDTSDIVTESAPVPVPAPARRPVVVASYQPPSFKPTVPKPSLRPQVVESGIAGAALHSLNVHDWTIQIGAFTDLTQARTQLATYAEKSMDILGQAQRIVVPFQSIDGQLLYRARFGPFLEREARQVCARLTERGQTCFAAISTR
ncbi:MAG TPA: SPOR domain-containing protein [Rhizomicrobium sp.]